MSLMPLTRPFPPRFNLGQLLASVAGGGAPLFRSGAVGSVCSTLAGSCARSSLHKPCGRWDAATANEWRRACPIHNGSWAADPIALALGGHTHVAYARRCAAYRDAAPKSEQPPPQKGMSKGQIIAGIFGDMLAGVAGRPGMFAQTMQRRRELEEQRSAEEARWHRDRNAKREDDLRPRVEQVGDALGMLDPQAQKFEPFYRRPQAFEAYAEAQGYEPGTPEYAQAVEDYRLGSWSDPALENRTGLEEVKSDDRLEFEAFKAAKRLRELNLRLGVTRRGQDLTDSRVRRGQDIGSRDRVRGQDMTDSRVRGSATYQGRGGRGAAARAINPATGQAAVLKNGRWVDERTGKPVQ